MTDRDITQRVVITGMGAITPLGLDVGSTWESLLEGRSGVGYITAFDTESMRVNFAAEVKGFDPGDFMERKESRRLDRFTQFAAVAAKEALAQARLDIEQVDPYRAAVILGSGVGGVLSLTGEMQTMSEQGPRRVRASRCSRVAYPLLRAKP